MTQGAVARRLLPRDPIVAVTVVALAITAVVTLTPFLRFAYRSETLHVSLEATGGLITMIAGYLVFGRHVTSGSARDLYLAAALFVLGVNGLLLAFPWGGIGGRGDLFIWRGIISRIIGASLLAAAAFLPSHEPAHERKRHPRPGLKVALLVVASVALSLLAGSLIDIDPGLPRDVSPAASGRPAFVGDPLLLVAQLIVMVLYAMAAFALRRASKEDDDVLLRWLAMGASVLAVSRLHYFLFPSIYSEWAYTGDFFRLAGQLMFLIGSALEIRGYWKTRAAIAVIDERRMIAHELHDGLAQELALIVGNARRLRAPDLSSGSRSRTLDVIAMASERALREARFAIKVLSAGDPKDLAGAVRSAAEDAAAGHDCRLIVDVDPSIAIPLRAQEALRWIVAEAVTNAVKHAGARQITVRSAGNGARWTIYVEDDGSGFDDRRDPQSGFGLTMMDERARAMGVDFAMASQPGSGTRITLSRREGAPDGRR